MFLALISVLLHYFSSVLALAPFDPLKYHVSAVTCPAIDRDLGRAVNITIEYVDVNPLAESTILMVHGWPSLWSSWGKQIQHLEGDHRLIAIDIRGFGGSSHPPDVESSSTMADITGDLVCVLGHAGVASAICLGHDWGSATCYEAARRRPDVFSGVIGVTVPYLPSAGKFISVESIADQIPTLSYQVFFAQNTSAATIELNKDITRTLRGTLRSVASPPPDTFLRSRETFMGIWDGIEIPPIPYLSEEEENYFIQRFKRQGFGHSLMFYTNGNKYGTWRSAHDQGNFTIHQPVLSVLPLQDPVADWMMVSKLLDVAKYVPQMTTKTMNGAHWPHMEFPDVFNAIVDEWLAETGGLKGVVSSGVGGPQTEEDPRGRHAVIDEL